MTAKTSAARSNAFFKALSETGNQTISAERACVSRSWVSQHRQNDPAFRARMDDCIAAARGRLSGAGGVACGKVVGAKWGVINGEELVLRGSNGRRAQVARARIGQITPRVEARFLSVLRRTCNVKMACVAVGISAAAAYKHRNRWAEFERAWDVAIQDGHCALEMALLENGIRALDPDGGSEVGGLAEEPALPMVPISADDAIRILGQRRYHVTGYGKRSGHRRPRPTEEETNAAILKRLRVLAMRNGVGRNGAELSPAQRAWKGGG